MTPTGARLDLQKTYVEITQRQAAAASAEASRKVVEQQERDRAVALEYDEKTMGAPTVTAKGREEMAASIRELAKEHGVPILQNVPLARGLYEVELGTEIPAELYEAVAEVLSWVEQLRQEMET